MRTKGRREILGPALESANMRARDPVVPKRNESDRGKYPSKRSRPRGKGRHGWVMAGGLIRRIRDLLGSGKAAGGGDKPDASRGRASDIQSRNQQNGDEQDGDEIDPYNPFPEPVVIEFRDVIDLHSIPPNLIKTVIEDYVEEAHRRGVRQVRIIHGKGIGVQREMVRAILARSEFVVSFQDAPAEAGGWGGTIARIRER